MNEDFTLTFEITKLLWGSSFFNDGSIHCDVLEMLVSIFKVKWYPVAFRTYIFFPLQPIYFFPFIGYAVIQHRSKISSQPPRKHQNIFHLHIFLLQFSTISAEGLFRSRTHKSLRIFLDEWRYNISFICNNWISRLIIHTELQSFLSDDTFMPSNVYWTVHHRNSWRIED